MNWARITDIILISSILSLSVFAILGLCQLFSRKSIKKVDRSLLAMFIPLILMAVAYFVFNHFLIWNVRPNGSGEASFPSSHVMVVSTIFFCIALILPQYIHSKLACASLNLLMLLLIVFTAIGRVVSNMHWMSDVFGALAFSAIFAFVYFLIIRRKKHA